MLPGLDHTRRRCHQGEVDGSQELIGFGRARRSCFHTNNHGTHCSSNSLQQRNTASLNLQGCELEGAARTAKERLDERFRWQQKSKSKSLNGKESAKFDTLCTGKLYPQMEIYGSKKGNSKRFTWRMFCLKRFGEDECAVCLEGLKKGETLVHLPCGHRFHSRCLVPWLVSNANCPCCRTDIIT